MKRLLFVAALAALLGMAVPAQAEPIIDFGPGIPGGTLTVTGSTIVGKDIAIGTLSVEDSPIFGDASWMNVVAFLNFDSSADGNNFSIVGYVGDPLNVGSANMLVTLLSGRIDHWLWSPQSKSLQIWGPDTKDPVLLRALGFDPEMPFNFMSFDLAGNAIKDMPNTYSAMSYDVRNTAVPEPSSMLLLGTGLFGLAAAVRRRMK